jgi:hypothetical protein
MALPSLALFVGVLALFAGVGIKGATENNTPEVGVGASNIENGSPVDLMPVGVAVIETSLSSMPNAEQAIMKPNTWQLSA